MFDESPDACAWSKMQNNNLIWVMGGSNVCSFFAVMMTPQNQRTGSYVQYVR